MPSIAGVATNFANRLQSPLASFTRGQQIGEQREFKTQANDRANRLQGMQEDQVAQEGIRKRIGTQVFAAKAADTEQKFMLAQQNGMLPESVRFDQRDAFIDEGLTHVLGPQGKLDYDQQQADNTFRQTQADKPKSPLVTVDASNKGETKLAETLGGLDAKRIDSISTEADDAFGAIDNLNELSALIDSGFETGFGAETKAGVGRMLTAIGVPESAVTSLGLREFANAEQFMRATNELVLKNMKFLKGAMSDKELGFLKSAGPQIGNSREGNKRIIKILTAAAERKGLKEDLAEEHLRENGSMRGFNKTWRTYLKENPLFDPSEFNVEPDEASLPPGFIPVGQ